MVSIGMRSGKGETRKQQRQAIFSLRNRFVLITAVYRDIGPFAFFKICVKFTASLYGMYNVSRTLYLAQEYGIWARKIITCEDFFIRGQ